MLNVEQDLLDGIDLGYNISDRNNIFQFSIFLSNAITVTVSERRSRHFKDKTFSPLKLGGFL